MQYLVTPNAQNAIHNIVNDFRSGIHSFTIIGSYGTGKSSFLLALESDLQKTGKQKYLLDAQNLSDAKSFEIMNIVGDYAEMSTLLSKALNVEGNTTSILDSLKNYYTQCQKKGKFLLIVVDEFGKVLEHAAKNNPEKELYFLQKLSELVNVPTRNMMLLTTLHQNFGAYAKGLTEAQANEWTKVKGRFKEITFVEPVEQLLYLASAQLQEERTISDAENAKSLFELAKETRYVSKDFLLETAIQLYPLDVFSAYTITTAIQRYGQNERSLFTFLAAKGTNSISEFEPTDHQTYNLQKVYDYILYNFYSYLKDANADSMSWSTIQVSIERVEGQDWANEEEMLQAVKLVKAIGLLNLFGTAGFKLTERNLTDYAREAMAIDNAKEIIQKLSAKKIIRFAAYKERLMLFEGTDVDLEAEIREAGMMVSRPVTFVDELNVFFNRRISPVKAHFYQKGTPRFFDYMIREEPIDIVPTGDTDGYIELIFSTHKKALEEIKKFSSETDHALIFAYFTNTEDIIDHLYNIKKYMYLLERVLDKNDRVAVTEIQKLKEYEETLLNKAISDNLFSYKNRVVWVFAGKEQKVQSHRDFNQLLSRVCNEVYCKTPVMNNELFNKHKLSGTITAARKSYLTYLTGAETNGEVSKSFVGVWESIIARMKKEDRVGTAENYQWALNSFLKYAGDVKGFKVDKNVIEKWNEVMKNGVMENGKLVGQIADATRGMYLRTCRVVWNECIRQGYLTEDKYPFSNKDNTLISIPRGKRRQQSYLSVDEMTQLYQVFIEKRYPEAWGPEYRKRAHQSLGLFLAQYLCNGFNLADAGRLQYNRTYFAEGGRAFEFMRKKTSARSNSMSVVIVPIIEPLKLILDEIAAKPEKGAFVFPQIFNGITDELQRRKLTVQDNSNIKDRMNRICKDVLGWDKVVSGTWARHSFATNLKLAGVEELYISESMGHSQGNDVTSGYQDMYPLEIRFRNNSKLLNVEKKHESINIDKLSKKEMKELLLKMMAKVN